MPKKYSRRRPSRRFVLLIKRISRHLRLFWLSVLILIGSGLVFVVVGLFLVFRTPFAQASIGGEAFSSDLSQYALLLIQVDDRQSATPQIESINLLSINPQLATAVMISIPANLKLQDFTEYGDIQLDSVYSLGGSDEEGRVESLKMLVKTVERLLAVPVNKYVLTDTKGMAAISQHVGCKLSWNEFDNLITYRQVINLPQLLPDIRGALASDLTWGELTNLVRVLISIRQDKITKVELREEDFTPDLVLVDKKLHELVQDTQIYEERLTVQVLNGTSVAGVATHVGRMVENLGAKVIDVGNTTDQSTDVSYLLVRDLDSYSVSRLAEVLDIQTIREYDQTYGIRNRADISVVVGLDKITKFK